jgi:hypothetical protein
MKITSKNTRKLKLIAAATLGCALWGALPAQAQNVAVPATATSAPAPVASAAAAAEPVAKVMTYALVSAVGDQLNVVRQKQSVGSNMIDNTTRKTLKIDGNVLNAAVLRGLDKEIEARDPKANRIFLRLNPDEVKNVLASEREEAIISKLVSALEKNPDRKNWDRIIAVTPAWVLSERKGMGSKLQGIGIYIQPLGQGSLEDVGSVESGGVSTSITPDSGEETITPDGKPGKTSYQYVAPYFYTQTWVFDAKTMELIAKESRFDFQKIYDPKSTALDVGNQMPLEQLFTNLTTFVESASARAYRRAVPNISIGDIKPVANATPSTPAPVAK